jgi:DNA invertase Pin-like site-specific DNA recombinase
MPKAFIYIRVSRPRQAETGLGLEAQRQACENYIKQELVPKGFEYDPAWAVYQDAAVTGTKPFLDRPAGFALNVASNAGDAIVVMRMDRAFRSLKDMATITDHWVSKKVAFHIVALRVDTASPIGRLMVGMLGSVAEFEHSLISERTREALRVRIETKGYWYRACPWIGYKLVYRGGYRGKATLMENEYEQSLMAEAWRLHYDCGLSVEDVRYLFYTEEIVNPRSKGKPTVWWIYRLLNAEQLKRARGGNLPPEPGPRSPKGISGRGRHCGVGKRVWERRLGIRSSTAFQPKAKLDPKLIQPPGELDAEDLLHPEEVRDREPSDHRPGESDLCGVPSGGIHSDAPPIVLPVREPGYSPEQSEEL